MKTVFDSKFIIFVIAAGLGVWILILIFIPRNETIPDAVWNEAKANHTISSNPHLGLLWERSIFTSDNNSGNACIAMNGLLYVMGSEQQTGNLKMIAIDSSTGETAWTENNLSGFTYTTDQLFLDDGIILRSISAVDGTKNWSTSLFLARNIINTYFYNNLLFVSGSGFPFFVVDPDNGRVIKSYASIDRFRTEYPNLPFFPSSSEPFETIIIDEDVIRTQGEITFSISRLHIKPLIINWKIENDSISNATIINNLLFYISRSDKFKAIDVNTGELLFETTIQPSIGFEKINSNSQHDGYYVCSDNEEKLLYVILGDSRQLFAFSLLE